MMLLYFSCLYSALINYSHLVVGVFGVWGCWGLGLGVYSSAGPISHEVSCGGLRSLLDPHVLRVVLGRYSCMLVGTRGVVQVYAGIPHIREVTLGQHLILT